MLSARHVHRIHCGMDIGLLSLRMADTQMFLLGFGSVCDYVETAHCRVEVITWLVVNIGKGA